MKKILMFFMSLMMTCIVFAGDPPSNITTSSAHYRTTTAFTTGGFAFNIGTPPLQSKGIVWGTSPNPTIYGNRLTATPIDGSGYYIILSNLTAGTTYYYRAFATNFFGTTYGEDLSITLSTSCGVPTGLTLDGGSSDITTSTTINVWSNVSSNYDCHGCLNSIGFVLSTSHNPTISNGTVSYITSMDDHSSFSATFRSLTPNTIYYIRSFCNNSGGIGYSTEKAFTTKP
jgi:hypothetical protein